MNILRNHMKLFANKITNISLKLHLIETFIKGEIEFTFKMAKLFPRSSKTRKPFPNEIFRNNEKNSPLHLVLKLVYGLDLIELTNSRENCNAMLLCERKYQIISKISKLY